MTIFNEYYISYKLINYIFILSYYDNNNIGILC